MALDRSSLELGSIEARMGKSSHPMLGVTVGKSIDNAYSSDYLLEDCHQGHGFLELPDSQTQSSVALLSSRNLPYPGNKTCSLSLSAPWADGLLLVVHMINMRWDSARCLDYIRVCVHC